MTGPFGNSFHNRDSLIGTVLDGRYELTSVIGKGSAGWVYRAKHTVLGKDYAIKVLHRSSDHSQHIKRFKREAQSASAIGNPHIVDVMDFGVTPQNAVYIVMEHLEGESLGDYIKRNTPHMDTPGLVHIAEQICDGLEAAHQAGVIHRDLKPENIYLITRGDDPLFVKLLDFGIAKVAGSQTITKDGQIIGTPAYMSPEQCTGGAVDVRTDVYSLGVILYEMVSGNVPFHAEHWMALVEQHVNKKPPPLPVGIALQLSVVILRCLSKRREDRYPSMRDVKEALWQIPGLSVDASFDHFPKAHEVLTKKRASIVTKRMRSWPRFLVSGIFGLVALGAAAAITMQMVEHRRVNASRTKANAVIQQPLPSTKKVLIDSKPIQATLWSQGKMIGPTPQRVELAPNSSQIELQLKHDGYEDRTVVIGLHSPSEISVMLTPKEVPRSPNPPARPPRNTGVDQIRDPWAEH